MFKQKTTRKIELFDPERLLLQLFSLTLHKIAFVIGQYTNADVEHLQKNNTQKFVYINKKQYLCADVVC